MIFTLRSFISDLVVASLSFLISVMIDKEIPGHILIFRRLGRVRRDGVVVIVALVLASFDQQCLVACESETRGQGTTASTRADNDIFISFEINGCCQTSGKGKKPKEPAKNHCEGNAPARLCR